MKTIKNRPLRLLVLVPHRDVRRQLRTWSASLFNNGLSGAWSFPWVAPLAKLNRPLSAEELKRLARSLRKEVNLAGMPEIANTSRKGAETHRTFGSRTRSFFRGGDQGVSVVVNQDGHGSEALSVFGLPLDISLSDSFFNDTGGAVISPISPLVLGSAVLHSTFHIPHSTFPKISFRAAALANMSYRVLASGNGLYFDWKIGPLHWLPKRLPPIMHPRD